MAHEHEKKHEPEKKRRARGGGMPREHEEKVREAEDRMPKRKRGGKVHGDKVAPRPDRRARGGAMSEKDPTTAAGHMSKPEYETRTFKEDAHGKGRDTD